MSVSNIRSESEPKILDLFLSPKYRDVFQLIRDYLGIQDIKNLRLVSKEFKKVFNDNIEKYLKPMFDYFFHTNKVGLKKIKETTDKFLATEKNYQKYYHSQPPMVDPSYASTEIIEYFKKKDFFAFANVIADAL